MQTRKASCSCAQTNLPHPPCMKPAGFDRRVLLNLYSMGLFLNVIYLPRVENTA